MKSKPEVNRSEIISNTIASSMAGYILQVQKAFAEWMEYHTKRWTKGQQKVFLYLLCIVFGGLSMISIVMSKTADKVYKTVGNNLIKMPVKDNKGTAILITEDELKQVQEYKRQHPHLSKDRPGLYDSLTLVEDLYYSQKK